MDRIVLYRDVRAGGSAFAGSEFEVGEFSGEAGFRPDPDGAGLICRETGILRFRGANYPAARGTLWRFPGGGRIEVRREDGRPFHEFADRDPQAVHLCGDDRYRVRYEFGDDRWTSVWEVEGPNKDYRMTTTYSRREEGGRRARHALNAPISSKRRQVAPSQSSNGL